MDYKELIELLRDESNCDVLDYIGDAATAIETLLAERDAAISKIPKHCSDCIHWGKMKIESPCRECWYSSGPRKNWQWRGPTSPDRERTEG